jgi:hypothetical protein
VRQANLAPQLRDERVPDSLDPGEADDERSPEELRTMLSSIQKGWLRGRSATDGGAERSDDAEPALAAGHPEGTERTEAAEQIDEDQREDQ